jgi:hypothetical protein
VLLGDSIRLLQLLVGSSISMVLLLLLLGPCRWLLVLLLLLSMQTHEGGL